MDINQVSVVMYINVHLIDFWKSIHWPPFIECNLLTYFFFININTAALTVQNILQQLRGVNLLEIKYSKSLLTIPPSKLCELKSAHHSTDEQEAAVVRYWLLRDPLASWREIIRQLDFWAIKNDYGHYGGIADRIRHYAEELTGKILIQSCHYYKLLYSVTLISDSISFSVYSYDHGAIP